jgi:DNA mismatch repair protein MutS2
LVARLAATRELAARLVERAELPLAGAIDVRSWLASFHAGEHVLQARDLADLKRLLRAGSGADGCALTPALQRMASDVPDLGDLVDELELLVDDRGEVLDSASPKLASVRAQIEVARLAVDTTMAAVSATPRCASACSQASRPGGMGDRCCR